MEGNCVRKGRNGRKLCKERAEWKEIVQGKGGMEGNY
jgi:hypothetical protein